MTSNSNQFNQQTAAHSQDVKHLIEPEWVHHSNSMKIDTQAPLPQPQGEAGAKRAIPVQSPRLRNVQSLPEGMNQSMFVNIASRPDPAFDFFDTAAYERDVHATASAPMANGASPATLHTKQDLMFQTAMYRSLPTSGFNTPQDSLPQSRRSSVDEQVIHMDVQKLRGSPQTYSPIQMNGLRLQVPESSGSPMGMGSFRVPITPLCDSPRSEYSGVTDKQQQRLIKNRQAAKESRKKRKEYVFNLEAAVDQLKMQNQMLKRRLMVYQERYGVIEPASMDQLVQHIDLVQPVQNEASTRSSKRSASQSSSNEE